MKKKVICLLLVAIFFLYGCAAKEEKNEETQEMIIYDIGSFFPDKELKEIRYWEGDTYTKISDEVKLQEVEGILSKLNGYVEELEVPVEGFIRIDFIYAEEDFSVRMTSESITIGGIRYYVEDYMAKTLLDVCRKILQEKGGDREIKNGTLD